MNFIYATMNAQRQLAALRAAVSVIDQDPLNYTMYSTANEVGRVAAYTLYEDVAHGIISNDIPWEMKKDMPLFLLREAETVLRELILCRAHLQEVIDIGKQYGLPNTISQVNYQLTKLSEHTRDYARKVLEARAQLSALNS